MNKSIYFFFIIFLIPLKQFSMELLKNITGYALKIDKFQHDMLKCIPQNPNIKITPEDQIKMLKKFTDFLGLDTNNIINYNDQGEPTMNVDYEKIIKQKIQEKYSDGVTDKFQYSSGKKQLNNETIEKIKNQYLDDIKISKISPIKKDTNDDILFHKKSKSIIHLIKDEAFKIKNFSKIIITFFIIIIYLLFFFIIKSSFFNINFPFFRNKVFITESINPYEGCD